MQESIPKFYNELWFIILMAGLGLILLAIFLGLLLHKALNKPPFTRERPPLVPMPLQKRSPIGVYPPSDSYLRNEWIFRQMEIVTNGPISRHYGNSFCSSKAVYDNFRLYQGQLTSHN
ncbi:hypothetical protein SKAU_G00193930 [Synaphobranchus kaupii]|uniref:Uncharacterized protein n=1 Tax=Synaphobranchus kaupii TaxID=118154 RepID=A0A9Q1FE64_SYNKA|nr:hypothetical protein SKAU_G00193930 [Synaphobranchus kaupii]